MRKHDLYFTDDREFFGFGDTKGFVHFPFGCDLAYGIGFFFGRPGASWSILKEEESTRFSHQVPHEFLFTPA